MHTTELLREAAAAAKMPETVLAGAICHYATMRSLSPDEADPAEWADLLVEHAEAVREFVEPQAINEDVTQPSMAAGGIDGIADNLAPPADNKLEQWWNRVKGGLNR